MGLLKFVAKATGTAVLAATGVASHVVSVALDAVGGDGTIFDVLEQTSYNTVRDIWNSETSVVESSDDSRENDETAQSEYNSLKKQIRKKEASLRAAESSKMQIRKILRMSQKKLKESIAAGIEVDEQEIEKKCEELQNKYDHLDMTCISLRTQIQNLQTTLMEVEAEMQSDNK